MSDRSAEKSVLEYHSIFGITFTNTAIDGAWMANHAATYIMLKGCPCTSAALAMAYPGRGRFAFIGDTCDDPGLHSVLAQMCRRTCWQASETIKADELACQTSVSSKHDAKGNGMAEPGQGNTEPTKGSGDSTTLTATSTSVYANAARGNGQSNLIANGRSMAPISGNTGPQSGAGGAAVTSIGQAII
ncbi:hypothetical protein SEUCBS140593_004059 [Sporothrix eucalyptigena]|uniref:Uncharacterized protein n=1 Tax=Sporothrix eucalyptigena TaxID=1812306 RepID=A0ABP0BJW6_9PEZI